MNRQTYNIDELLSFLFKILGIDKKPSNKFLIYIFLPGIVALWLLSGVYQVKEGSGAIILRFGTMVRCASPGLNYHLPYPFEKAIVERIDYSRRVEIGYRSGMQGITGYIPDESNILTSDENIVRLKCDVSWHIKNLSQFLLKVQNPNSVIKTISQSAIREVVSETPILDLLSNKKQEIGMKIESVLQRIADNYSLGIQIDKVYLLAAEPPQEVVNAYRDVQSSKADKEKEINQALAYRNDVVTRAQGEVVKIVREAEAEKQELISKALGETKRFKSVLSQYTLNKDITRYRLYSEAMASILQNGEKVVIGGKVLQHLPLESSSTKVKNEK
ncbi:FtsH protease activity modulator HflK [Candidatus Sneabacter namystus]|uniref:Protein HflK n=1 Tax=Candidatus Sneabacter namystus TaxID=2601646 RepID=A0A5C0UIJ4_9RICK|nr:FtsH protease activity modulator HflK [Candidatus Sneabacter namystus]QEK39431.1 FtsH protease activity modulator HflK [Candidatus Sneabacter namystus]